MKVCYLGKIISLVASSEDGQVHAGLDHHAHQLLHQQLASVRNTHLADVFARVARLARVLQLLQVGGAEQPARAAHMHTVAVAYVEQTLFQEAA